MNLLPEQTNVIDFEKGNLLVSASAGSGKTFVMINRLIRLLIEGKADISEILCVTFTEKAAFELKSRINEKLIKAIREGLDTLGRLNGQLLKISSADISTIDSFCLRLVKSYFFKVDGVPADFSILDEDNEKLLQKEVISDLFEEYYVKGDKDFIYMTDCLVSGRKDDAIKDLIISLHDDFSINEDYYRYKQSAKQIYGDGWFENHIKTDIENSLASLIGQQKNIERLYEYYGKSFKSYGGASIEKAYCNCATMLDLIKKINTGSPFDCINDIVLAELPSTSPKNKNMENIDEYNAEYYKAVRLFSDCKSSFKLNYFGKNIEELKNDFMRTESLVNTLVSVTEEFTKRYNEEKLKEGFLDFNDIERYAYLILQNEEVRNAVKSKYKYVFIDEYQDVNGLQEGIFSLIANDNTFCVGDVKQSIYGFRGCDSTIFKNKEKYYTETSGNGYVKRLNYSFRSAKNIIDFVNRVFTYCMTEEACGIDYTTSMLQSGGVYDKEHSGGVNLYSVTVKKEDVDKEGPADITVYDLLEGGKLSKKIDYSVENAVADKVQYYLDGKTYYDCDKGKEVKIKPEDIAVLVRNMSGGGIKKLLRVFGSRGIPISGSPKENLLEYKEVKVIKALVDLLNCYKQDIPLAICLKSLFGITDNELLKIKSAFYNERYFYQSVDKYISAVDGVDADLKNRLKEIKDYLFFERERAKYIGIDKVLNEIIDKVNYLEKLTLSPLGELKAMHVESFIALASRGNNTMYLSDFVKFLGRDSIDKIMATGLDGGVKLITMHKSKGLEFPVVIIPYADATFNAKDRSQTVIMDDEWGIITKNFDFNSYTKSSNVIRNHATKRLERKNLCDETRLFYVALTRAKYYLDIFIKTKKGKGNNKINSFYRLIPPTYNYEEIQSDSNITESNITTAFDFEKADVDTEKLIEKYVNFDYAYKNSLNLPLKASVTASLNNDNEDNVKYVFTDRESSIKAGLTAHKIMEKVDFYKPFDIELEKLIRSGEITKEELSEIDINCIKNTLTLPVFDRIKGYTFYKEQQFISRINASDLFEGTDSNDSVVLQGIIDLLAVKNNKAVIVDYKFSERQGENLIEHYKKQLYLYKHAVETVLGIDVKECYIVNLKKSVEYKI